MLNYIYHHSFINPKENMFFGSIRSGEPSSPTQPSTALHDDDPNAMPSIVLKSISKLHA